MHTEDGEARLGLCLVSTDQDGTTCQAVASTEVFATLDDLKRGLERMRAACELPMMTFSRGEQLGKGFEESIEAVEQLEARWDTARMRAVEES